MAKLKNIFTVFGLFLSTMLSAQSKDSLPEVKISALKQAAIIEAVSPVQTFPQEKISRIVTSSVADVARQFSGVLLKDYGGLGGLKTISVRSLGAQHTAMLYDGLPVADAQAGQVDLGKYSVNNVVEISLYHMAQPDALLPARSVAAASILSLITLNKNDSARNDKIKMVFTTGSFNYINGSLKYLLKQSRKWRSSIFVDLKNAEGSYKYTAFNNKDSVRQRQNADVFSLQTEYNVKGALDKNNQVLFKAFYYNGNRGLPGPVYAYNTTYTGERMSEDLFFAQAIWDKAWGSKTRYSSGVKFSRQFSKYVNPTFQNNAGKLVNSFVQPEYYFFTAVGHQFSKNIKAKFAADFFRNELFRTDSFAYQFTHPKRKTFLANLNVFGNVQRLLLQGGILFSAIKNNDDIAAQKTELHWAPSGGFNWQPINLFPMHLRGSIKHIYRMPNFNDLYYTLMGNTNLRPEKLNAFNAGVTYSRYLTHRFPLITFTADVYHNDVKDKILAIPRGNLFQWTMSNTGIVKVYGADMQLQMRYKPLLAMDAGFQGNYSYQKAIDKSDKLLSTFNTQVPYTPYSSGNVLMWCDFKKYSFSYNMLWSGSRYAAGGNNFSNYLKPYTTHDIKIAYLYNSNWRLALEASNILNTQYEIVKNYPMLRRSIRLALNYSKP